MHQAGPHHFPREIRALHRCRCLPPCKAGTRSLKGILRVNRPQVGPALPPPPHPQELEPKPGGTRSPLPNFCLHSSDVCIFPHIAQELSSTEQRRDFACSCTPKYPGSSSKKGFFLASFGVQLIVVKAVSDFITFFLLSGCSVGVTWQR